MGEFHLSLNPSKDVIQADVLPTYWKSSLDCAPVLLHRSGKLFVASAFAKGSHGHMHSYVQVLLGISAVQAH